MKVMHVNDDDDRMHPDKGVCIGDSLYEIENMKKSNSRAGDAHKTNNRRDACDCYK
jgi:hypothetical protein